MKTCHKNSEAVSRLTPEQYQVTQKDWTERPFDNRSWDNNEPGLYVDVVSVEPLLPPSTSSSAVAAGPASSSRSMLTTSSIAAIRATA